MLVVLFSWLYILIICTLSGFFINRLLKKLIPGLQDLKLSAFIVAGITGITIYAELFSIFYKVGLIAHLFLLFISLFTLFLYRSDLKALWHSYKNHLFSWEGFFYVCLILVIAFFTSRGSFHTDTNIYHAQMIRLYEEFGLIKGMANLQLHYGYNSAYLAFASIFSLSWLLPFSLHTTTGFIEVFISIYACHGLKDFKTHKYHLADSVRIAILLYTIVNITGSISPATDYAAMFLTLYVLCAWLEARESNAGVPIYALLCVLTVFLATVKLSVAALAVLAVYPACHLIKEKKWKDIGLYILLGMICILPYLIRNVMISGWLIYPFEGIDLFDFQFKVPRDYLLVDSYQIKTWGRCLYDISKIDMPMKSWLPVWWNGQERYAQMLIAANFLGLLLAGANIVFKIIHRIKIEFTLVIVYVGLICSLGVWFILAPFIRYGLSFLLVLPFLSIGCYLDYEKKGFQSILTGFLTFCIFLCFCPYISHYATDAGVFIKQQLKEPYYVLQKDYDDAATDSYDYNGNTIYYSVDGIINSYHYFPNTCYEFMLGRSKLMGDSIKDGFMPSASE